MKIDFELLKHLYNQRQSSFPRADLRIHGVRFYRDRPDVLRATMAFGLLDFDEYENPIIDGKPVAGTMAVASCPDDAETIIKTTASPRRIDGQIIDLAWYCGCCDMVRYQFRDRFEWFFKPSWRATFTRGGKRLADQHINNDGLRLTASHKLFSQHIAAADDFMRVGVDCFDQIYEFCNTKKTIKMEA